MPCGSASECLRGASSTLTSAVHMMASLASASREASCCLALVLHITWPSKSQSWKSIQSTADSPDVPVLPNAEENDEDCITAGAEQAQRPARVMNALESLAAWKDMDSSSMAKLLMGMTAEARTELRASYAALAKGNDKMVAATEQC